MYKSLEVISTGKIYKMVNICIVFYAYLSFGMRIAATWGMIFPDFVVLFVTKFALHLQSKRQPWQSALKFPVRGFPALSGASTGLALLAE
jgi:hypothetical protein